MAKATCSIEDCERSAEKRSWCRMHYARWQRHGDPLILLRNRASGTPEERFWTKVRKTETCWLWTAACYPNGYGMFAPSMREHVMAHRYAYELLVGPIPEGLPLDHVKARGCTSKLCVNPAHLEPVTQRENLHRGMGWSGRNHRKTHCPAGHPYDEANTYIHNGQRSCRICKRIRNRESNRRYRARKRAERSTQ